MATGLARLRYRANIQTLNDRVVVILAAPLNDVARATSSLIKALLLIGGGVLLVGGAATWWTVHRAIRPVGEMVETAETIAAGDLTSRVPDTATTSELNRLGTALNEMLSHIEDAVTNERAGQERSVSSVPMPPTSCAPPSQPSPAMPSYIAPVASPPPPPRATPGPASDERAEFLLT